MTIKRYDIEEAINGFRVNIWPENFAVRKENTETYLEALELIRHDINREIVKEQTKRHGG
jgi:hypothetical protein